MRLPNGSGSDPAVEGKGEGVTFTFVKNNGRTVEFHHCDSYQEAATRFQFAYGYWPECPCGPSDHWHEDKFGEERIECSCGCPECAEF